jgi:hypothetical protein
VALNHAPVNTVRLFEAFDFLSAAETWLQAHNPVLVSARRVRLPPGTGDALSRLMLKKNEKLMAQAIPGLTSGATGLIRVVTAADFATVVLTSTLSRSHLNFLPKPR